jgi:Cd2+/Zn2+-exporting ATPase
MSEHIDASEGNIWVYAIIIMAFTMSFSFILDKAMLNIPINISLISFIFEATLGELLLQIAITLLGLYIGYIGLKELLFEKRFSVEFLMSIASIGALYIGFLYEAAMVLFLYSIAEFFEDYIEDRAKRTIESLSKYMPETARVIEDGKERICGIKEVSPGSIILIRPGERIPLDGIIIEGFSYIDQAPVTGESMPIPKKKGDEVYGGTLNIDGVIKIRVTKPSDKTLISRIIKLVTESRARKAKMEQIVKRVARIYVPLVIISAILTILIGTNFLTSNLNTWIYRSLILLVIACPSAFIISVPATFFSALTLAARKGVVIKGGIYIEKLSEIKAVVFDKTGTLTFGSPEIYIDCQNTHIENMEYLRYAAALEQYSNHPVAQAIIKKAIEINLDYKDLKVQNITEIPGKGVIGDVNGVEIGIGRYELMEIPDRAPLDKSEDGDGHTKVYIFYNKNLAAQLCLADKVREDAVVAVKELKEMGLHTIILTGDKEYVTKEIAEVLGVDEAYSELLPEDKLTLISKIRDKYGTVAMVGDGVNDAPALASADIGIAMGGTGVDVALESADVVLVKDELQQIPYLYRLSKKAMRIAKENIVVSLGTKIFLGILGIMGLIPLWFAVAVGDDGITMLLLLNILRQGTIK